MRKKRRRRKVFNSFFFFFFFFFSFVKNPSPLVVDISMKEQGKEEDYEVEKQKKMNEKRGSSSTLPCGITSESMKLLEDDEDIKDIIEVKKRKKRKNIRNVYLLQ